MTPKTIAVIGGLDADQITIARRIPGRGESVLATEYLEALGGKGANSAIATYRTSHKKPTEGSTMLYGLEPRKNALAQDSTGESDKENIHVKMIGAVGDDQHGEKFILELARNGVDASGIVTVPNMRSSVCFVMVDELTRENRCLFTLGATVSWKKEDFLTAEQLGGGIRPDIVVAQMEIDKDIIETTIQTAGKAGIYFCLNAAPATPIGKRYYRHLTHLLVNESEAAIMSGRDRDEVSTDTWSIIGQEFLDRGVKNVVIALGHRGAYFANESNSGHCPAYDVKVEDTTGAGDTFTGTYASEFVREKARGNWDMRSAVIRANKAAAITIQSFGAQCDIPWADEIDGFDAPLKAPAGPGAAIFHKQ